MCVYLFLVSPCFFSLHQNCISQLLPMMCYCFVRRLEWKYQPQMLMKSFKSVQSPDMAVSDKLHESTFWARKKSTPASLLNIILMTIADSVAILEKSKIMILKAFVLHFTDQFFLNYL